MVAGDDQIRWQVIVEAALLEGLDGESKNSLLTAVMKQLITLKSVVKVVYSI